MSSNQTRKRPQTKKLGIKINFNKGNMECQFPTTETRIKPAGAHRGAGKPISESFERNESFKRNAWSLIVNYQGEPVTTVKETIFLSKHPSAFLRLAAQGLRDGDAVG
jgi:hypothetical protein